MKNVVIVHHRDNAGRVFVQRIENVTKCILIDSQVHNTDFITGEQLPQHTVATFIAVSAEGFDTEEVKKKDGMFCIDVGVSEHTPVMDISKWRGMIGHTE